MSRLFVGGLSFNTEEEGLRSAFSQYGEIIDTRIVTDRESGRSRGFGFVTFLSEADADTAMEKMRGQFLDGRVIRVDRAAPRPSPPRSELPATETFEQGPPKDWGSIPSPIASVPQSAGLSQFSSTSPLSSTLSDSMGALPDLGSLASHNNTMNTPSPSPPFSFSPPSDISPPTRASTKDTGPSFDFIDLDLSNLPPPDPNRLARRRPPRIRPSSMSDYEFGYYMSETSKFPFNTNFETGFQKPKGPDFEFDFTDIREAAAVKKAEEMAMKKAKEAEEAARLQAKEVVGVADKPVDEPVVVKQVEETLSYTMQDPEMGSNAAGCSQIALHVEISSSANWTQEGSSASSQPFPAGSLHAFHQLNTKDCSNAAMPDTSQVINEELQQAA